MIVVSDTTPLNYLLIINAIDVLPELFEEVYVPPSVIGEMTRPKSPEIVRAWAKLPPRWMKVMIPSSRLPSTASLDDGEADAISLAKELHITDVLIDERQGRRIARQEGLNPLPTLAILERAAEHNLLELKSAITRLRQTSIRIPQKYIDAALERDAARKRR